MYTHVIGWICLLTSVNVIGCAYAAQRRPVIGILAQETNEQQKQYGDSFIYSAYVKYMEQAGALVVPVSIKQPKVYYENLFKKLNGVVFPGGDVSLINSSFALSAQHFFNMSLQAYRKGDFFPILGICLGFEELTVLRTKSCLLGSCSGIDQASSLIFTNDASQSRLFRHLPDDLFEAMKKWNVTYNNHKYCMTTEVFNKTKQLAKFYRVLSRDFAKDGTEFISTIEAYNYPIYGTQWHPEKNIYLWSDAHVNHSAIAVRVSQYIADFFVDEARKSQHSYEVDDLANSVISNYHPKFMGAPSFHEIYFFHNN